MEFGKEIQKQRKKKNLTVKEVIKLLDRKISCSYFTKIELHGEIPNPEMIGKLSKILDLNIYFLCHLAYKQKVYNFSKNYADVLNKVISEFR